MLQNLALSNFRNIDASELTFSSGVNILVGANGQGKTNILEGIYYLALLRSFRTSRISDLKQWKAPVFQLHGVVQEAGVPSTELYVMYGEERRLSINGFPIYRTSEFINQFICVTFIPQDMELIRGGEVLRRRFLDIAISQLSPVYLKNLQAYSNALKSRNALLRDIQKYSRNVVVAYDQVLVESGVQLELARRDFVEQLNQSLERKSIGLIEDGRKISAKYLSGIGTLLQSNTDDADTLKKRFFENLDRTYERDCREGCTHIGPHRAALSCLLNDVMLAHYGSEGECRMASLAMKFASLDIIRQKLPEKDVTLLVDDVTGELDAQRQKNFFKELQNTGQIILASMYIYDVFKDNAQIFHVNGGFAKPESTVN